MQKKEKNIDSYLFNPYSEPDFLTDHDFVYNYFEPTSSISEKVSYYSIRLGIYLGIKEKEKISIDIHKKYEKV